MPSFFIYGLIASKQEIAPKLDIFETSCMSRKIKKLIKTRLHHFPARLRGMA